MTGLRKQGALLLLIGLFLLSPGRPVAQDGADEEAARQEIQSAMPEGSAAMGTERAVENSPGPAASPEAVVQKIEETAAANTETLGFIPRLGIAFAVVILQAVLIRLLWFLFHWLNDKAAAWGAANIKPLTVKKLRLLNTKQIIEALLFALKVAKYLVTVFQLVLTLPIIFSLFSATEKIATTLFGYILTPLKNILIGAVEYIPKLITIIIILLVTKYVLRALKFFAVHIEKGRLQIPGFYADWAQPTFNILRVLLYAFTAAIIYPYLPGSDSKFFQGISVFVGVIFSLGSSSAIGNVVAGMVLTYMRPFKVGDFIKIKDLTGTVIEKSAFVVRIRNKKNEYITFPNLTVLTSEIINYNTSADNDQGLIIHVDVTMTYTDPWRRVHEALLAAADKTSRTEKSPRPFVLQKVLDDFYVRYEINVYTKAVEELPGVYSELYANIQDEFREAGMDLTSPHFFQQYVPVNQGAAAGTAIVVPAAMPIATPPVVPAALPAETPSAAPPVTPDEDAPSPSAPKKVKRRKKTGPEAESR